MKNEIKHVRVGVGVFIFNDKNQVLLQKRQGSHGSGEWSLPGGHLEMYEDVVSACAREAKEETDLDIDEKELKLVCFTEDKMKQWDKHYITIFYATVYKENKQPRIVEPEKCSEIGWFDWNNMPKPLFSPLDKLNSNYTVEEILKEKK